MTSSKPSCRCGPRLAPGCGTATVAIRTEQREPTSPEIGSTDERPGRPRRLAVSWLINRAMASARVPQLLDLGGAALHRVELAKNVGGLPGDRVGDLGQHARAFFRGGVLWAAEPAGRRDRADIGEHRLVAARAAQLVHLVAMRVVGRVVDAVEMDEVGPEREHRQRLDLAAVGEPVAGLA